MNNVGVNQILDIIEGPTRLRLTDDSYARVDFSVSFPFYSSNYASVYVGSNGYLTFGNGDTDYSESVNDFLGTEPRIALLFDDFNPSNVDNPLTEGVFYEQLDNPSRLRISFINVPQYGNNDDNSFTVTFHQILGFGIIEINYSSVSALDGIVGITPGGGSPESHAVDFSNTPINNLLGALYEQFTSGFDLNGVNLIFTPNGNDGYNVTTN